MLEEAPDAELRWCFLFVLDPADWEAMEYVWAPLCASAPNGHLQTVERPQEEPCNVKLGRAAHLADRRPQRLLSFWG